MVGAAIAASAVVGGVTSSMAAGAQANAAGDAGALSLQAQMASIDEQRRQYNQTRTDLAPYRETGQNALSQYSALFGIGRGVADPNTPEFIDQRYQTGTRGTGVYEQGQPAQVGDGDSGFEEVEIMEPIYGTRQVKNPDYVRGDGLLSSDEMQAARDRFKETPGYDFRMTEGIKALDRSAAARGSLKGGGYGRELQRYGQGIAADEFNNYANRLAGIAGMGQGATTTTATLGQQSANGISNTLMAGAQQQGGALMAAGTARASGYAGVGNAVQGGLGNYMTLSALQGGGF